MSLIHAVAEDGTVIQFIYDEPRQGAMKDVYFAPDRSYVVAFFRDKLSDLGYERLSRLIGIYRQGIFEQAGGDYWRNLFCWPEKIVRHDGMVGLVMPAYLPHFFFDPKGELSGAEKEGKWFTSAKNLNLFVPPDEKGSLTGYLRVCLNLSRAVRRLHAAGLAHSDLSYKNCLVDPMTGSACIIDIDSLVVPDLFPPDVLGTQDFIAPEVIATQHLRFDDKQRRHPCRETDQHALAVLIYQYLLHRHPLRGKKIHARDQLEQETLEMGKNALFIEHPHDNSNRLEIHEGDQDFQPWIDCAKLPYTITGPYLSALFEQAFIDGLHDPRQRPTADNWEHALVKTFDMVLPCGNSSCPQRWFVFNNKEVTICPYCQAPYQGQLPILNLYSTRNGVDYHYDNHRILVYSDQYLYSWHTERTVFPNERLTAAQNTPVGYFIFHNNRWLFVNQSLDKMRDIGRDYTVPIGKPVELYNDQRLLLSPGLNGRMAHVMLLQN